MNKHTPLPWKQAIAIHEDGGIHIFSLSDAEKCPAVAFGDTPKQTFANAEFIAQACNCHDELLEACKTVLPYIEAGESGPNGFTVVFPADVDPFIVARAVAQVEGGGA